MAACTLLSPVLKYQTDFGMRLTSCCLAWCSGCLLVSETPVWNSEMLQTPGRPPGIFSFRICEAALELVRVINAEADLLCVGSV